MNFGLVLLIFFVGCGRVGAEEKSYPTNKQVELIGTVKEGTGYDANNKREGYYFLSLEEPISVDADEFGDEEKRVRDIQLVPLSDAGIGRFLGKKIEVQGKLFHSFSAHHHTKILLQVGKSDDTRLADAAGNDGVMDVRWDVTIYPDEALKATKVGDFKALLEASWSEKMPVIVKKNERSAPEKLQLQSCAQLFGVERNLYKTEEPADWAILMESLLRCKAMQIMTRMRPSKVSYVNTDVLALVPDLAKLRLQSRSDPVRLFFSGLGEKAIERKCFRKDLCRVSTKGDAYLLSIVGAGDYNGDGIEDLVLIASSRPLRGTATSAFSLGFVMTREVPGKPLKILTRFEKAD